MKTISVNSHIFGRFHLLQASLSVLVTSSRGQEIIVITTKPSVATVPMSTDHPARVFGEKRYLAKSYLIFTLMRK